MNILVIDNYDSFVYTIVSYLRELGATTTVVRNDAISVEEAANYDAVLVSPGPGEPSEAGISLDMIGYCAEHEVPMLGVCLGHQALGEKFGGTVSPAPELMHGKTSTITHDGAGIFAGLPERLEVTRYHSLAVVPDSIPDELVPTATVRTLDGATNIIMAMKHATLPLTGVQFHPEAYLTTCGKQMLANWLDSVSAFHAAQ